MNEAYQAYLNSNHWKELRARKRFKAPKTGGKCRCAVCGSTEQIETHHLQYRNLFDVQLSDLRMLCRECHGLTHELLSAGLIKWKKDTHTARFRATLMAIQKVRNLQPKILKFFRPGPQTRKAIRTLAHDLSLNTGIGKFTLDNLVQDGVMEPNLLQAALASKPPIYNGQQRV